MSTQSADTERLDQINDELAALAASHGIVLSDAALDDLTHHVARLFDLFDPQHNDGDDRG